MDIWNRVLERVKKTLHERPYQTWFAPTRLLREDEGRLTVEVPNRLFQEWINNTYGDLLHEVIEKMQPRVRSVKFVARIRSSATADGGTVVAGPSGNGRGKKTAPARRQQTATAATATEETRRGSMPSVVLNPRYSFDSFVVSSCNQFAHAAAQAVAENPSHSYNPLYIYGGVGLGKTHLMHAIGNILTTSNPDLSLCYVTTENFMNELITAIRRDRTFEFKDKYRGVDVLLVDDIQFLQKKERTQEEFFHTFNQLYELQKQIVLTSDCPPRNIPALEERLRSRFEWGLIADIQPPDLETKVAILNKKAEGEGVSLPDDVALFVAAKVKSNVRELEGCLVRLVAYAAFMKRAIDLDMARDVLQDLVGDGVRTTTVESIQRAVAQAFGVRVAQIRDRDNSREVAMARHAAMYICKQITQLSLPEIGRRFGGKHHSTVLHAVRKVARHRQEDADLDRRLNALLESFQ
ncbi:MAG: chromosomal replication initiator protein DnaA [Acidobacteria bacterium]|nr:chromosomal replication initiator protein DnaA [Acidobacteriota bacterium]